MSGDFSFSGKKILYVTSTWAGLLDVLTGESKQPKGMPAFFYPLIELGRQGAKIDLIVFSDQIIDKKKITDTYFINTTITILPWPRDKRVRSILVLFSSFFRLYLRAKRKEPDFIYALGTRGVLGVLVSKILKVPVGVRVFGINKYFEYYKALGTFKFILRSPLFFLSFRLKSDFLLATDDGSVADKLFQEIGSKDTKFLFWKNGFDPIVLFDHKEIVGKPFMLYPSRISDKKQQIKAVDLLYALDIKGYKSIRLKLVGHVTDQKYYDKVFEYANSLGLRQRVEFCGTFEKKVLFNYMKQAEVVLSLQKVSNLGNTLIEALNCESVVLSYKEPPLEAFLENGESAILVDNLSSAADAVLSILNRPELAVKMRRSGKSALYSEFDNWDNRVCKELALIKSVIK